MTLPSYRRFPDDEEFKRELKVRDLYNFPRRSYWLRRMENFGRKERVPVAEYTIEHILPQNRELSVEWRTALGPDRERNQETWLHTHGNLTLTGYNSEYSDHSFAHKRDMEVGFKVSPLRLNEKLGEIETWNEAAIQERAERLARLAVKVWPAPTLPPATLAIHSKEAERPHGYTVEDHSYLSASSPMRPLFDALRKQILSLDPVVTEEVLKLYVAYKAETNFVDVIAQTKRLMLMLNMPFHEVIDPKGLCRDVSAIGRWGNGDVEITISTLDELPYAIGLIRQAFEKQMGNGENA
jgi:predicted transport protein